MLSKTLNLTDFRLDSSTQWKTGIGYSKQIALGHFQYSS